MVLPISPSIFGISVAKTRSGIDHYRKTVTNEDEVKSMLNDGNPRWQLCNYYSCRSSSFKGFDKALYGVEYKLYNAKCKRGR